MTSLKAHDLRVGTAIQLWDDCRGVVVWVAGNDTPLTRFRGYGELGAGCVVVSTAAGAIHYSDFQGVDLAAILGQIPIELLQGLSEAEVRELLESEDRFNAAVTGIDQ